MATNVAHYANTDFNALTVKELRASAKELEVKNTSNLRKADLVAALEEVVAINSSGGRYVRPSKETKKAREYLSSLNGLRNARQALDTTRGNYRDGYEDFSEVQRLEERVKKEYRESNRLGAELLKLTGHNPAKTNAWIVANELVAEYDEEYHRALHAKPSFDTRTLNLRSEAFVKRLLNSLLTSGFEVPVRIDESTSHAYTDGGNVYISVELDTDKLSQYGGESFVPGTRLAFGEKKHIKDVRAELLFAEDEYVYRSLLLELSRYLNEPGTEAYDMTKIVDVKIPKEGGK